jgi:hypothetical protein
LEGSERGQHVERPVNGDRASHLYAEDIEPGQRLKAEQRDVDKEAG